MVIDKDICLQKCELSVKQKQNIGIKDAFSIYMSSDFKTKELSFKL